MMEEIYTLGCANASSPNFSTVWPKSTVNFPRTKGLGAIKSKFCRNVYCIAIEPSSHSSAEIGGVVDVAAQEWNLM
jgi:hypothetical protein